MFKAVLFDMDGTLADTELMHTKAAEKALGTKLHLKDVIGMSDHEVWRRFSGHDYEDFIRRKDALYTDMLDEVKPVPGLKGFLAGLRKRNITMGIVSSSTRKAVEATIDMLGIKSYFSIIVSADDVEEKKPSPEPYLKALQSLGLIDSDTIAIEDSPHGIASAKSARLKCIALLTYYNREELKNADYFFKDYTKIRGVL